MDVYQRRRLAALGAIGAVILLIVIAIGTCGGDDDETPVPVTEIGGATGPGLASLPKDDFIEQADAICAETDAGLEGITTAEATRAARQEAELASGQYEQLQTLPPPEEDAETFAVFAGALEEEVTALGDREVALERGDDAALAEIDAAVSSAEADAAAAAEDFGFDVCGDPAVRGDEAAEATGAAEAPAPTEVAPAPTEVAPAPTEPAPEVTPEGGATPTPPADTGGDSESGGVSP
jgi:hypothetical protein